MLRKYKTAVTSILYGDENYSGFCYPGLVLIEQRHQNIFVFFKNLKQILIPMSCVLLAVAKDIVLLTVVDNIETRHGFGCACGSVCGNVSKSKCDFRIRVADPTAQILASIRLL